MNVPLNSIIQGHVLDVLRTIPDKSIDMCVTSPPYWGLRAYGTKPQVWGGPPDCKHMWGETFLPIHPGQVEQTKWKNAIGAGAAGNTASGQFCRKCQAWRGELGLEPSFFQYIEHLCMVFDEIKRVLKDEATLWVNLGDTYAQGISATLEIIMVRSRFQKSLTNPYAKYPTASRSQCATAAGFYATNFIWHKPNCMPASAKDRFTVDFEKIFFFSKKPKYYFEPQYEPHSSKTHPYGPTVVLMQTWTSLDGEDGGSPEVNRCEDIKEGPIATLSGATSEQSGELRPSPFPKHISPSIPTSWSRHQ